MSPCHDEDVGCFIRSIVVLELAAVEVAARPELGDFFLAHLLAGRLQGRAVELADLLEAFLVALLLHVVREASKAKIGSGRFGYDDRWVGDGKREVDPVTRRSRESAVGDKPSRAHLHDEEDGHAETDTKADDGGKDDGDGFLVESHLRELRGGGGHRGVAAATGQSHRAGGTGRREAHGLAGAAHSRSHGSGRRRAERDGLARDSGHRFN